MTSVTISLPESLKAFLDRQLATKGYGNVSDSFRSLLRDAQKEEEDARLKARLLEGLAGGADIPMTPEFWKALKAEARDIAQKRKAQKRSCRQLFARGRRTISSAKFRWYLVEQNAPEAAFRFVEAVEASIEQ